MSPGERLTPAAALEAIEEAMAIGEHEHGDRWRTRSVEHHVRKALGHAFAGGPLGRRIDEDSGLPHLTLAATRLVLALAVAINRANAELEVRRP